MPDRPGSRAALRRRRAASVVRSGVPEPPRPCGRSPSLRGGPRRRVPPGDRHARRWASPADPQLRWDSGVETGCSVGVEFDPMLAKVVAHAPTRTEALRRLALGLERARIRGVETNRDFLVAALRHRDMLADRASTAFVEHSGVALAREPDPDEVRTAALAPPSVPRRSAPGAQLRRRRPARRERRVEHPPRRPGQEPGGVAASLGWSSYPRSCWPADRGDPRRRRRTGSGRGRFLLGLVWVGRQAPARQAPARRRPPGRRAPGGLALQALAGRRASPRVTRRRRLPVSGIAGVMLGRPGAPGRRNYRDT